MRTSPNHSTRRPFHTPTKLTLTALAAGLVFLIPAQVHGHGAPVIDGLYTGDWCAPAQVGAFGPDSLTPLGPPLCALGSEIFWDDWDSVNYGAGVADTIGYLLGGIAGLPGTPGVPVSDPEVDIEFFATTADATTVFFTVAVGSFPGAAGPGIPPHIQIAVDIDGPLTGNPLWLDPLAVGLPPVGIAAIPPPGPVPGLAPDYLITSDGPAGIGYLWEATTAPGFWTLVGQIPLAWSGPTAFPAPGIFEIAVPWALFTPGPQFAPGTPAFMTMMTTHGAASAPGTTFADAPMTPPDDVFSEIGAVFTTSPDVCPPGPPSTDCEVFVAPGSAIVSADAFIQVLYPTADLAITKTNGVTSVVPGTPVTYTITATHAGGPSNVTGATVTDTFPAALTGCTWTCIGIGGGTCTPMGTGNINDTVNLPTGASVTYTATCSLPSTATGSLVNTATIVPPIGIIEPNTGNDTATDTDTILGLDYGDAPDPTHPTLLANDGARHAIIGPFLGVGVDADPDGQPTATATGDDFDGNDDEDGVSFTSAVVAGQPANVTVTASGPGLLDAWVDVNLNGWFDPGEQVFVSTPLAPGANFLSFTPHSAAPAGATSSRFRFSSAGGLVPWGLAMDGEVEDHQLSLTRSSDLAISKTDSRDPADSGLELLYTLTTTNNGPSDASGVILTDILPANTSFVQSTPGSPTCTQSSGTVTCNLGTLASGASTIVTINVLVSSSFTGNISNSASVSATESDPVPGNNTDSETTTILAPVFSDGFETGNTTSWSTAVS